MKVLMLNGSPRAKGNTALALEEMEKIFKEEQIETEILHIGHKEHSRLHCVPPVRAEREMRL